MTTVIKQMPNFIFSTTKICMGKSNDAVNVIIRDNNELNETKTDLC